MLAKTRHVLGRCALSIGAGAATVALAAGGGTANRLVNMGPIDPATWVRGPLYAAPTTHPIWNPAKLDHLNGREWALGTQSTYDLTGYCATAMKPAAVDMPATWTEMQHSANDWTEVWAMWDQACAYVPVSGPGVITAGAHVPGSRLSTLLKRDIEKALDGGAMQIVVPTVDSVEEAQDIIDLIYFPPIGHRSYGPSQAAQMYANVPGGYRETFNDNVNVIFMIETILGSEAANDIAANGHVDGLFGATSDLGNFSGYLSGDADYEKLIRNAYDIPHAHGQGACTAFGFRGRVANPKFPAPLGGFVYAFDCYQN